MANMQGVKIGPWFRDARWQGLDEKENQTMMHPEPNLR